MAKGAALVRLAVSALEAVRRYVDAGPQVRACAGSVFEGTLILFKNVAPPAPDGTQEVVLTFRVLRAGDGPAPKFLIVQTTLPASHPVQPGARCLIRAGDDAGPRAVELGPGVVRRLREAQVLPLAAAAVCAGTAA